PGECVYLGVTLREERERTAGVTAEQERLTKGGGHLVVQFPPHRDRVAGQPETHRTQAADLGKAPREIQAAPTPEEIPAGPSAHGPETVQPPVAGAAP